MPFTRCDRHEDRQAVRDPGAEDEVVDGASDLAHNEIVKHKCGFLSKQLGSRFPMFTLLEGHFPFLLISELTEFPAGFHLHQNYDVRVIVACSNHTV